MKRYARSRLKEDDTFWDRGGTDATTDAAAGRKAPTDAQGAAVHGAYDNRDDTTAKLSGAGHGAPSHNGNTQYVRDLCICRRCFDVTADAADARATDSPTRRQLTILADRIEVPCGSRKRNGAALGLDRGPPPPRVAEPASPSRSIQEKDQ